MRRVVQADMRRRFTENVGGTEASFPVSLASVLTGTMTSALGAGGCSADDAKKVACSVAEIKTSLNNVASLME